VRVYCLEQRAGDLPVENDWLSAAERATLSSLRFPKRRADWRLGRWTGKQAVASYLNLPADPPALANIEIRPAPSGAPEVFVADSPAPVTISLSHRDGMALCAITSSTGAPGVDLAVDLGCDLEIVEPRSDAFVADYLTPQERALVAGSAEVDRQRILALVWSAKESALKALREGLRLDTRMVIVSASGNCCESDHWSPMQVRCANGVIFSGWWQITRNVVRTVVANPPPDLPVSLNASSRFPDNVCSNVRKRTLKTHSIDSTVY